MKVVICFLLLVKAGSTLALIPLEGIIFGGVDEVKQYDPFSETLSYAYSGTKEGGLDEDKLNYYYALYKQGTTLKNTCDMETSVNYSSLWKKAAATRSVAATLQYIGLDLSLKSIVHYAKKIEMSDKEFTNLAENLITNTCSKNVSVYSLKLLKNNFMREWELDSPALNRHTLQKAYFSSNLKIRQDTQEVTRREFNYSIRNFRAFCSWNGDSDDYRMLVPYLKNPYIMSLVFNHLKGKKLKINKKTRETMLVENKKTIKVACEDLICRRRSDFDFDRIFPRMLGSSNMNDDLSNLYCEHFSKVRYQRSSLNKVISGWINKQVENEYKIEALHFLSLMTEVPEIMLTVNKLSDIALYLQENIKDRWNQWSDKKVHQLHNDHLYEEPLEITLEEQSQTPRVSSGKFNVVFDIGLSELDKLLVGVDKIDSTFMLQFPIKYFAFLKRRIGYFYKTGQRTKANKIEKKFTQMILYQIKLRKNQLNLPIWNARLAKLISVELLKQINVYLGNELDVFSTKMIKVPVKFRFGTFALRYIWKKNTFYKNERKVLTSN